MLVDRIANSDSDSEEIEQVPQLEHGARAGGVARGSTPGAKAARRR